MLTASKKKTIPGGATSIYLDHVTPAYIALNGDRDATQLYGEFDIHHERYTPNSTKSRNAGRREWKSFEHWKAFRENPKTALMPVKVASFWQSYPDYLSADVAGVRFGTIGYTDGGAIYYPFGEPGLPISGLTGYQEDREDGGFVPAPSNLDALKQSALRHMLPTIKEELSIVNSLIELRDFSSLPSLIRSVTRLDSRLIKKPKDPRSLMELLRVTAGGVLSYQFAIAPLLSDIQGVYNALSRTERRINDLITRSGRVQVKHYNYTWAEIPSEEDFSDNYLAREPFPVSQEDTAGSYSQFVYHYLHRISNSDPTEFHAMIEYNYNYTQYQLEHARILSLLDAFGVNFNPNIVWNATRWTFVLDWVFRVSRWLDQFKVQNMEPKINIRRFLWSVKRHRKVSFIRVGFTANYGEVPPSFHNSRVPLPVVDETAYRREVDIPTASSIESSGLSLKEFTLGAALVIARSRRPRKPPVIR